MAATEGSVCRVVVDGRSGAGKTSFARALVERWPHAGGARLVSLEDFYPGWGGLAAATDIAEELVEAHARGREGRYRRWDWERDREQDGEVAVDPRESLVLEGCGSLTRATASRATTTVWLDGDAAARRERALDRDGDGFRPFWAMWAEQEERHIIRHAPRERAQIAAAMC